MATLFDISAEVPVADVNAFIAACNRYRDELGNSQPVAMRRGVINLIKSLRHDTPKAKKQAPLADIKRSEQPRYLTPKGHNQQSSPAWRVRRRGGKDEKNYLYTGSTRSEVRRKHAQYTRFGLAKKSWGWFMQRLFGKNNPERTNPKAVVDARMADGYLREIVTGKNPRVDVLIVNKLNYIRDILPTGALTAAMRRATNSINAQINKGLAKAKKELV